MQFRRGLGVICAVFGYSRQGYYKHKHANAKKSVRDELALNQVRQIRTRQPMVGTRKLLKMMENDAEQVISIGRDYMFGLLADHNMLIEKKKSFVNTTDFAHEMKIHPNLLADMDINKPNQAWVVDITYLRTCDGFAYLALVTDYYSRKILGHSVSDSLSTDVICKAFRIASAKMDNLTGLIHHSDHGSQYCSKKYVKLVTNQGAVLSMTGKNHCYDNARAERVNGILKQEFGLKKMMGSLEIAKQAAADAINIYNTERLHLSLGYQTPECAYAA